LLDPVRLLAREAGKAILEIYARADHDIVDKDDASPLTAADLAAHHLIIAGLQQLTPDIPILSEESATIPWQERKLWQRYWLVDPLDGTKEFIKRNGEFTVNIALIENGMPVLGVVYAPVLDWLYSGVQGQGASKLSGDTGKAIHCAMIDPAQRHLRVVASRNHRGEALDAWLERLQPRYPDIETVSMGSSLKICLVAEGKADVYPRLAPTCEWDTAAAQAVLEAAGGALVDPEGEPLRYNQKDAMLNPHFLAVGDRTWELQLPAASGA
jgi:3'(2'), 5'-bisphosphate nucleotidase